MLPSRFRIILFIPTPHVVRLERVFTIAFCPQIILFYSTIDTKSSGLGAIFREIILRD